MREPSSERHCLEQREREREIERERWGGGGRGWQGAPISANISLTISDMT